MIAGWNQIPAELKALPQWCIAAPDKSPWTVGGQRASSTAPSTWAPFEHAVGVASEWGSKLGIVLAANDPFTCIDIDIKDESNAPGKPELWTTPEQHMRYELIVRTFDSYTERSASGKGYHIWVRGSVGAGHRREGVEVYDRERFMICTGNTVNGKPIEERQELLNLLISEMQAAAERADAVQLLDVEEVESDAIIYERASTASNSDKFNGLWAATSCTGVEPNKVHGSYSELGYPTQSEADLSLLSMLTFYSKSNAQVRRLFRHSGLGQRDKATKNDKYLNRTLTIIRSRQAREEASSEQGKAMAIALIGRLPPKPLMEVEAHGQMDWPPGAVGVIARWMYSIAPRPVKEVAIVSALGFYAGIAGRAFNISNSGLNLYIVLVARSAVGKESMHSGISKLIHKMMQTFGGEVGNFIDFADYASGPALVKSLSQRSSFCNIAGEWGRKLRKMSDDHTEGPMASLRTAMTNLYQKSGAESIVGGIGYSDKEKDVKAVNGVAFSMIGETTPDTFYESLTNTMMQDGFMSRFIVIEYTGQRPEQNVNQVAPLDEAFLKRIQELCILCLGRGAGVAQPVEVEPDSQQMLDEFNARCDKEINSTDDESWRQMWNRAHLKVLKVCALLAVADNYEWPRVTVAHVTWALQLINRDISIMGRKMASGDVGDGDMVRERKILTTLRDYLGEHVGKGYGFPDAVRQAGVVPRKFLQIRVQRTNSFLKHRNGYSVALDSTLKSLVDSGYLVEVSRDKIPMDWGSVGKCYRILSLPDVT